MPKLTAILHIAHAVLWLWQALCSVLGSRKRPSRPVSSPPSSEPIDSSFTPRDGDAEAYRQAQQRRAGLKVRRGDDDDLPPATRRFPSPLMLVAIAALVWGAC